MENSKKTGDTQKSDDPCDDWSKQPLPSKKEKD
jgi:hypothetical protein